MINFFILNGDQKRTCTASDVSKATQILSLMFPTSRGYIVEDNKVVFAHNMTPDEAETVAGLKPMQSITLLAPKAALVKPKKTKAKKPVVKAKKTKLKSKVVVKNNKKPVVKKTVVKSKVKPKIKAKKSVKAKAKGKR